jgi:hypothetical protein
MLKILEERRRVGLLLSASVAITAGVQASVSRAGEAPAAPAQLGNAPAATSMAQFAAGPPGTRATGLDLSAAHALVREFAVDSAFAVADAALARVLANDAIAHGADRVDGAALRTLLGRYADELGDVVALRACPDALPEARIQVRDGVAFVHPGTGAIDLPEGTELVVVDLRHLPASDALDEILARVAAPALASDVARPSRLVRVHDGPVDEVQSATNTYSTSLSYRTEPAIASSGARDVPLVLLLGAHVGPQVASFAAALRVAGRAWIAGAGFPIEIAESTWQGVGSQGLMVRTSELATLTPGLRSSSGGEVAQGEIHVEDLDVTPDATWHISLAGSGADNLDLYLLRDDDGDGAVEDGEVVLSSANAGSVEHLDVIGATLPSTRHQILVLGRRVVGDTAPFTLERESARVTRLPDVIPADLPQRLEQFSDAVALRERLRGATPPPWGGAAQRSRPGLASPFGFLHPLAEGRGELRADLLITHGVLRLFYPYLSEVGDALDTRLFETLRAVDAYSGSDRFVAGQILRRFGEVLQDGHQFSNAPVFAGTLPVFLEYVGTRPIVRRSRVADIHPGDAIVALDGRPIEEVYAEELARTSASTEGYRLALAERYVYTMSGPRTLILEDTSGVQRSVTVDPQPFDVYDAAVAAGESDRPSGTLADQGAPDLYYLNMNAASTPSLDVALQALEEASAVGSRGMVLDMRGYPGVNHAEIAARLIQQPFISPQFETRGYVGPGESTVHVDQYTFEPIGSSAFEAPLVLLTGPHAVSAAENFMQMLLAADRVLAVVGRRSAGTNGNITGVTLPGRFLFTYTGLEVRNPDASPFFGIGIVPDHEVPMRAEDLRDGIDRALLEAIAILRDAVPAP